MQCIQSSAVFTGKADGGIEGPERGSGERSAGVGGGKEEGTNEVESGEGRRRTPSSLVLACLGLCRKNSPQKKISKIIF